MGAKGLERYTGGVVASRLSEGGSGLAQGEGTPAARIASANTSPTVCVPQPPHTHTRACMPSRVSPA
jgi:hypothetical protein